MKNDRDVVVESSLKRLSKYNSLMRPNVKEAISQELKSAYYTGRIVNSAEWKLLLASYKRKGGRDLWISGFCLIVCFLCLILVVMLQW